MGITFAFQMLLAYIAIRVAVGLYKKQNMWPLILTYWIVLSAKNLVDLFMMTA